MNENLQDQEPSLNASEQFDNLLDEAIAQIESSNIPKELQNSWIEHIEDAPDLISLKKYIQQIEEKIRKRNSIDSKRFATPEKTRVFVDSEQTTQMVNDVVREALVGNYEMAGDGMTATVYVSNKYSDVCYKIITNTEMYSQGLDVKRELEMQDKLTDLKVNGVRVPHPYAYYMNEQNHLCVMEKLNAATLQEIITSKQELPKEFDIDTRFDDLREFFSIMHTKYNIYHRDFHDKNIMFDLDNGTIYVIDFGKATNGFGDEREIYSDANGAVYPLTDEEQIEKNYIILKKFLKAKSSLNT